MKNSKTKKKSGVVKTIAVIALSAIMLAGGCIVGYGAGTHWTYKRGNVQTAIPDGGDTEIDNTENLLQLSKGENKGLKANIRSLKTSEYADYAVEENVLSVAVATVTLANHDEATNKTISLIAMFEDKSIDVKDPASGYIKFSSSRVQSGEEFTISCVKPFAHKIEIFAFAQGSSEDENGLHESCTIKADFVRRIEQIQMWVGNGVRNNNSFSRIKMNKYDKNTTNSKSEAPIYLEKYLDNRFGVGIEEFTIECSLEEGTISEGTMFEEVKDVKFGIAQLSDTYPVDNRLGFSLENIEGLNTQPSDMYDYPLFYRYSGGLNNAFWSKEVDSFLEHCITDYETAQREYTEGIASATMYIMFTGAITGIEYSFVADIIVNPAEMYVAAQNPSFDPDTSGGIIF
mgnify:CR=1 FL=1